MNYWDLDQAVHLAEGIRKHHFDYIGAQTNAISNLLIELDSLQDELLHTKSGFLDNEGNLRCNVLVSAKVVRQALTDPGSFGSALDAILGLVRTEITDFCERSQNDHRPTDSATTQTSA